MPGIMVHNITADRMLEKCNSETRSITESRHDLFLAGAQATDCFYFFKYKVLLNGWRTKMYGWATHHYRPKWFFMYMAKYMKEHYSDSLYSYVMGYISHYAVDKDVHGYVLEDAPALRAHTQLEQELEVLYSIKQGIDPFKYSREQFLKDCAIDENENEIGTMHLWLMKNVYRKVLTMEPKDYKKCFSDWAEAFRNIDDPTEKQRKEILQRNRFLAFDLDCFLFEQPDEIKDHDRFNKYYSALDKSVEEGVDYMNLVNDFIKDRITEDELADSIDNVNLQGNFVTPIEKKLKFMDFFMTNKEKPPY